MLNSIFFVDNLYGWVVGHNGMIFSTTDGGNIWTAQYTITKILNSVYFKDRFTGLAVGNNGLIIRTTDGYNWNVRSSSTTRHLRSVVMSGTSNGWIVGQGGVILYTTDGGTTWSVDDSPTSIDLWGIASLDSITNVAVGSSGTIIKSGNPAGPVPTPEILAQAKLINTYNYPNPFNPNTRIYFTVPKPDQVTVKVYDLLGRVVKTLIDKETVETGDHSVVFNSGDLSSGIYFYQVIFRNDDQRITKKMVLLR
jgi:photosystem II stability/assembly factor-like uncharacterized protein